MGHQGIRQKNPISPFLFVLCLEYLSRSLKQLKDNKDFNYHPKCQGQNITHTAFMDDLILFSKGDVASVQLLMNKLESFRDYSGLKNQSAKIQYFCSRYAQGGSQEYL